MNKRLTPEQDLDRLLDEDGGEFGAIYARLSRPEPPRRLDRTVLANAARAVHGGRAPRAQRWAVAMGSVTGVVLAAGIAWQVGKQMQSHDSVPEGSRSMQDSRVVPVEAITEPRPPRKVKSDLIMRDADAPAEAKEEAPNRMARSNKQITPAAAPPVETRVPTPAPALAPEAPPPPASASAPARPELLKSREAVGAQTTQQTSPMAADQMEAEAFPEDQGAALSESTSRAERVQGAAKKAEPAGGNSPALESRRALAPPQSATAPAMSADDSLNRNMRLTPQAWLEEIERLSDAGRRLEAIENLRLFRSQYPDWPLPDALLKLDQ